MDLTSLSMAFILSAIFVSLVILFGLILLFAKPENIERTGLVGSLTALTGLIGLLLLWQDHRSLHTAGTAGLVSICAVSLVGYVMGRFIDYTLGPRDLPEDTPEGKLNTDLAD